jgi:hypothetical protein
MHRRHETLQALFRGLRAAERRKAKPLSQRHFRVFLFVKTANSDIIVLTYTGEVVFMQILLYFDTSQ